jgi:hypothetical protein
MTLCSIQVNQHEILVAGNVLCFTVLFHVLMRDRVLQSGWYYQSLCINIAVSRSVESVSMLCPFTARFTSEDKCPCYSVHPHIQKGSIMAEYIIFNICNLFAATVHRTSTYFSEV